MGSIAVPSASTAPCELRFALRVHPECGQRPWHAELLAEDGERHDFATPLALIRHLAQLGPLSPRDGGLR